jgi:hypothetical protein
MKKLNPMSRNFQKQSNEQLVEAFAELAREQGEALKEGTLRKQIDEQNLSTQHLQR